MSEGPGRERGSQMVAPTPPGRPWGRRGGQCCRVPASPPRPGAGWSDAPSQEVVVKGSEGEAATTPAGQGASAEAPWPLRLVPQALRAQRAQFPPSGQEWGPAGARRPVTGLVWPTGGAGTELRARPGLRLPPSLEVGARSLCSASGPGPAEAVRKQHRHLGGSRDQGGRRGWGPRG